MRTIDDGVNPVLNFLLLNGSPNPLGERVKDITRPNVDSQAYRRQGKGGNVYQLFSRADADTEADIKTLLETYKTFMGKFVTIVDSLGNTRDNVMILAVNPNKNKTIVGAAGTLVSTLAGAILECTWDCQETDET